jgi:hypothetical protein
MWTINYKNHYINGYTDKPECEIVIMAGLYPNGTRIKAKSIHAAKIKISKLDKA